MKRWLATLTFLTKPTAEALALLPAERARVKEMIEQNLMETIYISSVAGTVWLVMNGETEEAVQATLSTLPMHKYFHITLNLLDS